MASAHRCDELSSCSDGAARACVSRVDFAAFFLSLPGDIAIDAQVLDVLARMRAILHSKNRAPHRTTSTRNAASKSARERNARRCTGKPW